MNKMEGKAGKGKGGVVRGTLTARLLSNGISRRSADDDNDNDTDEDDNDTNDDDEELSLSSKMKG